MVTETEKRETESSPYSPYLRRSLETSLTVFFISPYILPANIANLTNVRRIFVSHYNKIFFQLSLKLYELLFTLRNKVNMTP